MNECYFGNHRPAEDKLEEGERKWDARDLPQPRLRIDTAHAPTNVAIVADRVAWGRGEWN